MKANKRISALQFIRKIRQNEIDTLGKQIKSIRDLIATLDDESQRLKSEVIQEARISSPESASYLADYLIAVEKRQNFLEFQKTGLLGKAKEIEMQLTERFIQLKKFEIPLRKAEKELLVRRKTEELLINDETAHRAHFYRN